MAAGTSFEHVIDLARADLGAPEFQKWHAQLARDTLADYLASRTDTPEVVRIVDGHKGRVEDAVKLHGIIRYEFIRSAEAMPAILKWLHDEGMKVGAAYAESFFIAVLKQTDNTRARGRGKKHWTMYGAEGRPIPAKAFGTKHLPEGASFLIGNSKPYNRMVDVQMRGKERMRFSVSDQIYERAALWVRSRYPEYNARRIWTATWTGTVNGEEQWTLERGPRAGQKVHSPALILERV